MIKTQHCPNCETNAREAERWRVRADQYNDECERMGIKGQAIVDQLSAENEALRHDLERQMSIANEHVNEVERLREALAHIAFSGADGPYGEFGEALNEHQMRRVAKAALLEQSK